MHNRQLTSCADAGMLVPKARKQRPADSMPGVRQLEPMCGDLTRLGGWGSSVWQLCMQTQMDDKRQLDQF